MIVPSHPDHSRTWTFVGGFCGVVGVLAYSGAAFLPLPDTAAAVLAFAFGPLVSIASLGLAHAVGRGAPPGVGARIAAFLGAAAGVMVLAMLTVQQALFATYGRLSAGDPSHTSLMAVGDAVHFGLDIAWDVLISSSIIVFAVCMWRAPLFGKVFSATGVCFGVLLLVINLASFPVPPETLGRPDMGPFCALWLLAVYVRVLIRPSR